MTDWIFQANPRLYDVRAAVGKSRRDRWSTPRYRDRIALHDRIWLQIVGLDHPGIYYIATIVSPPYEKVDAQFGRWHTDIQWDYRIDPPLLRSELLGDPRLEAFRPFRGFQGTNVPLPPEVASRLSELAGPRLMPFAGKEDPAVSRELGVGAAIESHNAAVRQELKRNIEALTPAAFEAFVVRVLTELGFVVKHTGRANDGGVYAEAVLSPEGLTSVLTKSKPSGGLIRSRDESSASCAELSGSTNVGSS